MSWFFLNKTFINKTRNSLSLRYILPLIILLLSFKDLENTLQLLITKTFQHHLRNHEETRNALLIARDEIPQKIRHCSDNVQLVLYLDGVLKDPIKINVVSAENRLQITIKMNGQITYYWKKRTLRTHILKYLEEIMTYIKKKVTILIDSITDGAAEICKKKIILCQTKENYSKL